MFEVQRRLVHAERIAILLEEMLNKDSGLNEAVTDTYEGHIFITLRYQLFRSLISDICAAILDKGNKTGSVRSALKELRRCSSALDALKAYNSEVACLDITISGGGLSEKDKELQTEQEKNRYRNEQISIINDKWKKIDAESKILSSTAADRILWARNKVISHFEKNDNSLIGLNDMPPDGAGPFTWREPIDFIENVREYVYEVFKLVTSTHWSDDFTKVDKFYVQAFWDRFKNGATDLKPDF